MVNRRQFQAQTDRHTLNTVIELRLLIVCVYRILVTVCHDSIKDKNTPNSAMYAMTTLNCGATEETMQLAKILESHGFELSTVACTVNGGCNPVGQAMTLNQQGTELNVIMGLCMGHDVLPIMMLYPAITEGKPFEVKAL